MIKSNKEMKNADASVSPVYFFSKRQTKVPAEFAAVEGLVANAIKKEKSDVIQLYAHGKRAFAVVYFQGKTTDAENVTEDIRILGSRLCKAANAASVKSLILNNPTTVINKEQVISFVEGLELTNYEFFRHIKGNKPKNSLENVFVHDKNVKEQSLDELNNLLAAVSYSKDLVNEPVNFLNAQGLANAAVSQGKKLGFSVKVLNKKEITAQKMGGLLGVNAGSIDDPTFSILEYKPRGAKNKTPLVFVGKGVVYDTGGYNLKISGSMGTMKCDMGGAAAVIGSISAIAANKLPIHVVGLIPSTDNRIGLNALVQDDIITMSDGTTVEVQNTDAEGRLILADALVYAKKYNPMLVIDLATLTGACAAVTGPYGIGLMANKTKYKRALIESGNDTYERCAEFMMWREYNDLLKSDVADLKNIGGPTGGMITAAKFLEHFVKYDWIHLDIAGPAFIKEGAAHYHHKGGSAVGVRLLYNFAKKLSGKK
ncbi:MAG TPA: leucyl aminopeptidase family protein [Flavobacteriales bacterium]|nr:leucyl aminopeptidase family protein [Flavobacteriales bacterium]